MKFKFLLLSALLGFGLNAQEVPKDAAPKSISDIDSNFKIEELGGRQYRFINFDQKPFELSGFAWFDANHKLCRLPESIFPDINKGAQVLAWHTSGGMLRFKTDSKSVAIKAKIRSTGDMSHMARSGSNGFDVYLGSGSAKRYIKSAMPQGGSDKIEMNIYNGSGMQELTINFPLYNGINELSIGVDPECKVDTPTPYKYQKPILFYGSSITQGGCASRPGNNYSQLLGRWLDANVINLGFSGSAKGEPAIAEAIASLELTAFVMDYDHNAPDVAHLQNTHEKFFSIIREKQPNLPIIIVTKPDVAANSNSPRTDVIRKTYDNAIAAGDKNVYFVNGNTLFGTSNRDACTVDGCHPNDLGFMRMAETIYPVLKDAISK